MLALVLALLLAGVTRAAAQTPAPGPGAASSPPQVVAVPAGTGNGRSRLIVAVPGGRPPGPGAVAVTVDGAALPTEVTPLLSDRTATVVVVDASVAGAPVLQAGLSGAASVVLAAPPAARSALVVDTAPPAVVSALQAGPGDTLRGLAAVRAAGSRQTGVAVELALNELPPVADDPRLVLLYTGAPDAMGLPAADLVAHLNAAGAVLAVVVPSADGTVPPYWSAVAAATGGVAVGARGSGVIAAFDALLTALRTRWLVSFPAPARLPATAVVQVDTDRGQGSTAVEVPARVSATGAASGGSTVGLVIGLLVLAVLVGATVVLVRRRRGRTHDPNGPPAPGRGSRRPVVRTAWNIPDRPDPLVDRRRLTAALRDAVRSDGPVVLRPDADAQGAGTTTAMIDFAHRVRPDHDIAWWVPAADPPLVADRLAELAEVLGLAAPTDPAQVATDRLLAALRTRGRWLLIFDDAASPRQLARFMPTGPGHVLIGSSDPEWAQHATPVPVPAFTRAESVGLLGSRRPGLSRAEAENLAAALDDQPLAVDLTGATLAETGMSVGTCLRVLAEQGTGPAAGAVALDRLAADRPTESALLTLLAWLGPEPVPLSLLRDRPELLPGPLAQAVPAGLLDDLLTVAARRGLVRVDAVSVDAGPPDDRSVAMHPIVASLLVRRSGARTGPSGAAGWAATVVRLLHAAVPADATDPAGWPGLRRLLPHVLAATDPGRPLDDVPVEVGSLLLRTGCYLRERGEPRVARALFEDAHDLYHRRLGPDHPDTRSAARTLVDDPDTDYSDTDDSATDDSATDDSAPDDSAPDDRVLHDVDARGAGDPQGG